MRENFGLYLIVNMTFEDDVVLELFVKKSALGHQTFSLVKFTIFDEQKEVLNLKRHLQKFTFRRGKMRKKKLPLKKEK